VEGVLNQTVVRTERGLSIAGTRITLYLVMDYLKADWPPELIKNWLNITDAQMADVMAYIAGHREEVQAEYEEVLRTADENRAYWEQRNKDRLRIISQLPPEPGQEEIYAKIKKRKSELGIP